MSKVWRWHWIVALLAVLCLLPASASADDDEDASAEKSDEEEDEVDEDEALSRSLGMNSADDKIWQVSASTSFSAGIGAFVSDPNARRTRVRFGMNFGVSINIPEVGGTVSVGSGFSQWLSRGGGLNEPQEFRWGDTSLGYFRPIYTIPVAEIMIIGSLYFTIPTSRASLQSGLYTTISPELTFIRRFGPLSLIYDITYSHNFHQYTSTTYDPSDVDILSRSGGSERIAGDTIAAGGVLTEMSLFNTLGVNLGFSDFLFAIRFGFGDSWTYDNGTISSGDQFTNANADVGRGHSQFTFGTLRLSYVASQYFMASLWVSSQQPWKTADNKSFRFPFFDFESTANNFTYIGTTISGFY